ncbi:MAG: hypothetical protein JXC36_07845 [Candidatus Atribacteria bacterium]|nr:hypothetical protein [Candidatus Atribacteria bacterium]
MQPVGTLHRPNGGVPFCYSPKRKAQPQFVQTPGALAMRRMGQVWAQKLLVL